jgi:hypothetical protein
MNNLVSRLPLAGKSLFLTTALLLLQACSSGPKTDIDIKGPITEVFPATYDETWRAAAMVMKQYRMKVMDRELGILESESIRGYDAYKPPHTRETRSPGLRYKISMKVIKGMNSKRPLTKVIIIKRSELHRDFFSKPEEVQSDGLEEVSLMYRIKREIEIERALQKYQESQYN